MVSLLPRGSSGTACLGILLRKRVRRDLRSSVWGDLTKEVRSEADCLRLIRFSETRWKIFRPPCELLIALWRYGSWLSCRSSRWAGRSRAGAETFDFSRRPKSESPKSLLDALPTLLR